MFVDGRSSLMFDVSLWPEKKVEVDDVYKKIYLIE
jgi:hypothetical protein